MNKCVATLLAAALLTDLGCRTASASTIDDQPLPKGCKQVGNSYASPPASEVAAPGFPPLQLGLVTPFEPTAFPSAGRTYLIYELHIRNFETKSVGVRRVEVLDADTARKEPIAVFEEQQLDPLFRPRGPQLPSDKSNAGQLVAGQGTVAFFCLVFQGDEGPPKKLRHRVHTDAGMAEGASIGTHHTELRVLGPPVSGSNWQASSAPSNDSHHRVGLSVVDGRAQIARRYAIDWLQIEDGKMFSGDQLDNRSYYSYGKEVLAVANGTVVAVTDGLPDNEPRSAKGFRTAVPITMETIGGNSIDLDIGGGQFAHYAHLQSGSFRVKKGERVRRGQVLARIGSSGDARAPHLHFQVANAVSGLNSEGVPYLIDQYRVKLPDGTWHARKRELPLSDMVIDFGESRRSGK